MVGLSEPRASTLDEDVSKLIRGLGSRSTSNLVNAAVWFRSRTAPPSDTLGVEDFEKALGAIIFRHAQGESTSEDRLHLWIIAAASLNRLEREFDDDPSLILLPRVRSFVTDLLAVGESVLCDFPHDLQAESLQSNIRSRYWAWYNPMSDQTADAILDEVFGAA